MTVPDSFGFQIVSEHEARPTTYHLTNSHPTLLQHTIAKRSYITTEIFIFLNTYLGAG